MCVAIKSIMLSVVMLSVIVLNVVAPWQGMVKSPPPVEMIENSWLFYLLLLVIAYALNLQL